MASFVKKTSVDNETNMKNECILRKPTSQLVRDMSTLNRIIINAEIKFNNDDVPIRIVDVFDGLGDQIKTHTEQLADIINDGKVELLKGGSNVSALLSLFAFSMFIQFVSSSISVVPSAFTNLNQQIRQLIDDRTNIDERAIANRQTNAFLPLYMENQMNLLMRTLENNEGRCLFNVMINLYAGQTMENKQKLTDNIVNEIKSYPFKITNSMNNIMGNIMGSNTFFYKHINTPLNDNTPNTKSPIFTLFGEKAETEFKNFYDKYLKKIHENNSVYLKVAENMVTDEEIYNPNKLSFTELLRPKIAKMIDVYNEKLNDNNLPNMKDGDILMFACAMYGHSIDKSVNHAVIGLARKINGEVKLGIFDTNLLSILISYHTHIKILELLQKTNVLSAYNLLNSFKSNFKAIINKSIMTIKMITVEPNFFTENEKAENMNLFMTESNNPFESYYMHSFIAHVESLSLENIASSEIFPTQNQLGFFNLTHTDSQKIVSTIDELVTNVRNNEILKIINEIKNNSHYKILAFFLMFSFIACYLNPTIYREINKTNIAKKFNLLFTKLSESIQNNKNEGSIALKKVHKQINSMSQPKTKKYAPLLQTKSLEHPKVQTMRRQIKSWGGKKSNRKRINKQKSRRDKMIPYN